MGKMPYPLQLYIGFQYFLPPFHNVYQMTFFFSFVNLCENNWMLLQYFIHMKMSSQVRKQ